MYPKCVSTSRICPTNLRVFQCVCLTVTLQLGVGIVAKACRLEFFSSSESGLCFFLIILENHSPVFSISQHMAAHWKAASQAMIKAVRK